MLSIMPIGLPASFTVVSTATGTSLWISAPVRDEITVDRCGVDNPRHILTGSASLGGRETRFTDPQTSIPFALVVGAILNGDLLSSKTQGDPV